MAYEIACRDQNCQQVTWCRNVADLIRNRRNKDGFFVCGHCQGLGYVPKEFTT
ncbi:MAG: hypothetical protein LBP22_17005 [Deltaproteobacteria bacterium]|nr:hypothetical protein [Deltaproteobacteria bacterium]